jgi:hypothetical protein
MPVQELFFRSVSGRRGFSTQTWRDGRTLARGVVDSEGLAQGIDSTPLYILARAWEVEVSLVFSRRVCWLLLVCALLYFAVFDRWRRILSRPAMVLLLLLLVVDCNWE